MYTSDQQALKKFFQNVKKLPPIKYIRISELNDANSVEDYLSTFRLAMSLSDGVSEDDVLFYSMQGSDIKRDNECGDSRHT